MDEQRLLVQERGRGFDENERSQSVLDSISRLYSGGIMIIIQAEDGAIITNPKAIYIDKDLDGHLHIYADLSSTDRVKAVKLTVFDYSKEDLGQMLEKMYENMDRWLFTNQSRHYLIRMVEILDMTKQDRTEAAHD